MSLGSSRWPESTLVIESCENPASFTLSDCENYVNSSAQECRCVSVYACPIEHALRAGRVRFWNTMPNLVVDELYLTYFENK